MLVPVLGGSCFTCHCGVSSAAIMQMLIVLLINMMIVNSNHRRATKALYMVRYIDKLKKCL